MIYFDKENALATRAPTSGWVSWISEFSQDVKNVSFRKQLLCLTAQRLWLHCPVPGDQAPGLIWAGAEPPPRATIYFNLDINLIERPLPAQCNSVFPETWTMISFKKTFRQLIHWLHKPAENCEDEREDGDSWAFPEHRLGKHLFITCCITVIHGIYHIYYTAGDIQRYIADFQNFIEVSSRCDIACRVRIHVSVFVTSGGKKKHS